MGIETFKGVMLELGLLVGGTVSRVTSRVMSEPRMTKAIKELVPSGDLTFRPILIIFLPLLVFFITPGVHIR
ncbi:MAG: hypothetical protein ACP5NQ_09690 [Vulcanisaeta sp.]